MSENEMEIGTVGASFDDFMAEEGILEEVTEVAIKRVIALQIAQEMKAKHITKAAMAKKMNTSRAQIDRLLDPEHEGVTLGTMFKAAKAVGRRLQVSLS